MATLDGQASTLAATSAQRHDRKVFLEQKAQAYAADIDRATVGAQRRRGKGEREESRLLVVSENVDRRRGFFLLKDTNTPCPTEHA